jgi:hypothetical protein
MAEKGMARQMISPEEIASSTDSRLSLGWWVPYYTECPAWTNSLPRLVATFPAPMKLIFLLNNLKLKKK